MATLSVRLFGPGILTLNGKSIWPHSTKAVALLAFLAAESDRPHTRSKLAGLLWGRASDASSRQSLRQALYSLKTFADGVLDDCLETGHELVRFTPRAAVEVDVHRFLACVGAAESERWREAAALYRAPLLDGQPFEACDEFEAWLTSTRERLHALAAQNLDRLITDRMAQSDWVAALQHAESLRALDPLREDTSRHLFRIHSAQGDVLALEAEWARMRAALQRELGVPPSRQTQELYQTLRAREPMDTPPSAPHATEPRNAAAAEPLVRAARAAERVYAFGHALDLYERALGILKRAAPASPERTCEVLILKEAVLERLGRRADQLATVDEAIASAESLGEPARIATVLLRKAGVCAYLGDNAGARHAAERALALYRAAADRPGEAEALRELGFVHWCAEEHSTALQYAREALALHRNVGDVAGEGSALHNLAEIHRGLGSPKRALEWYDRALQLHWAAENREGEILTLFGIANAMQQVGDLAGSRQKYEAALALAERYGERTMQSRALHALAACCRAQGTLEDALRFMQRAIEVDRVINYAHALGHDLVELAGIHLERGERLEARAALQEALVWFGFTEDRRAVASAQERLDDLEAGRTPAPATSNGPGWVKSHLSLAEGKVYCEFESPLAGILRR
jgi:DNA-binding SARP family transcriptional activator/Tfp pilus assembly protein PilF